MRKKGDKTRKSNTIFSLLVRPTMAILLLLIGLYTILMHQQVLVYLRGNAVAVFDGQVTGRGASLTNEMVNRWSNIGDGADHLVEHLEEIVSSQGKMLADIQTDANLNQTILDQLMEDIIDMLRSCGSTEIYLILDGRAVAASESEQVKAGVYLRSNNPNYYSSDNQDLLLERGVPAISKKWQLSLDSYWSAGFDFTDREHSAYDYFYQPLEAARASENNDYENFAYWSYGSIVDPLDKEILSYSIPLIASDGTVLGVLGTGVSRDYLINYLDYRELLAGRNGAYFLARTTDGLHFAPVLFHGPGYYRNNFQRHVLEITAEDERGIRQLILEDGTDSNLCVCVQTLSLYNANTPFEQESWVLVGAIPEEELFDVYDSASMVLILLATYGVIVGILGIYMSSRQITGSLHRLLVELRNSDTNRPIHLQRLQVEEIDELVNAIESLSIRVAESSSKISSIIQMAESGIGVYEFRKAEETVFCSRSLYEIMGWSPVLDTNEYLEASLFKQRMAEFNTKRMPEEENLYQLQWEDGTSRWVRLNQQEQDGSIIGVVSDVTAQMLEKRQIEYERDYDTLTRLYNLRALSESVRKLSKLTPETLKISALVMWDLDNLKFVNDMYGHYMGDQYIISLADCLRRYQGERTLSARRSGDEFYTLFWGFDRKEEIKQILEELWQDVERADIELPNGNRYRTRVSAGVSWYPENSDKLSELFPFADFAMYTVKHSKKGDMVDFDPAAYHENWYLAHGQGDFNTLIDNRLVRYAAQPVISLSDGSVYGYEMLMRSEMESFRSPLEILRMAHAQSRLYDIEALTWFEALRTFVRLEEQGQVAKDCRVFINSIASQVLGEDMQQLLQEHYGDHLTRIVCEFTEEEEPDEQVTNRKLELLKIWRAGVAIDDYGCGYSSESMLLKLKPDMVKIDMGIVRGIENDENRQQLVCNLVRYAHERGILVLGEGVEHGEELRTLISLGVDLAQGYYIGKPDFQDVAPNEQVCREAREYYQSIFGAENVSI